MAARRLNPSPEQKGFARIVELIGETAAAELEVRFGGARLYIPHDPGPHHPITVAIGEVAARKLGQREGGGYLLMPLSGSKRARIVALRAEGLSIDQIRRRVMLTRRRVEQVLKEARDQAGDDQPGLF